MPQKSDSTDEELVALYVTEGNDAPFAELVTRYLSSVYSFALRLVGNEQAAEDITQEVFLKTWKSIKQYNPATSRFKTWLLRIARNSSIDYLRKRKHIPFSELSLKGGEDDDMEMANRLAEVVPDPDPLPDELFAQTQDIETLMRAVQELSPAHRDILTLHYTNHLTFEEIGQLLDQPQNTVKSRHHRALLALRKRLAPKEDE